MFQDAIAYERSMGRWSRLLAEKFADFVGIVDGDKVLDIGCGTGAMTQAVAQRTSQSSIFGIDTSDSFIGFARESLKDKRVRFEIGSAQKLPYSNQSFDLSVSLLLLMLVPSPHLAVSEMQRVTRAGGRIASCTWDAAGMQMIELLWQEMLRLDAEAERIVSRPSQCNREGDLCRLWQSLGLEKVEEIGIDMRTEFDSFADYWTPFVTGVGTRTAAYIGGLDQDHRDALEAAIEARLPLRIDGRFTLNAKAWAVKGIVPPR